MKIMNLNVFKLIFMALFTVSNCIYAVNDNKNIELSMLQNEITGTVTDAQGVPLPGVNILVKNSSTGTQTDFNGVYKIAATKGDILEFSFVGLKKQSITVGDSKVIDLTMHEDSESLNEVVVTALGIKRQKKSLTYATQNVDVGTIDEARPDQNLVNSLSGKVAGLSI